MTDLNTLTPQSSSLYLIFANDINDTARSPAARASSSAVPAASRRASSRRPPAARREFAAARRTRAAPAGRAAADAPQPLLPVTSQRGGHDRPPRLVISSSTWGGARVGPSRGPRDGLPHARVQQQPPLERLRRVSLRSVGRISDSIPPSQRQHASRETALGDGRCDGETLRRLQVPGDVKIVPPGIPRVWERSPRRSSSRCI